MIGANQSPRWSIYGSPLVFVSPDFSIFIIPKIPQRAKKDLPFQKFLSGEFLL
jgi:hypothetical protein